jgi:hypothetical protein
MSSAAANVKDHQAKAALLKVVDSWLFLVELAEKNAAAPPETEQHSTRQN